MTDSLKEHVRQRAEDEDISPSLLAGRRELERLVTGERELPILRGWRRTLVGENLLEML